MTTLLELRDVTVSYDGLRALAGVSLVVPEGCVVALLGPNGAGKTTTLRTISGLLRPDSGSITFDGRRIDRDKPYRIARAGVLHVPEGRGIFRSITVRANLEMASYSLERGTDAVAEASAVFPALGARMDQLAGTPSGGEQQMLALARAMLGRPRLLMLDEPSMGLSPIMMQLIFSTIGELRDAGTTILLVEQNASAALALADVGYVLETGRVVLSGPGHELLQDEKVRKAYLGED